MDRSNIIYLVNKNQSQNEYGVWVDNDELRKVYCEITSVSQSEWYEGGRNGLNPEFRVRMFVYDYQGEQELIYNDNVYSIYRTYVDKNETIDLYVEKKKGVE